MHYLGNEQGSALLLTVVISLILLTLGGVLVTHGLFERAQVEREEARLKAYYLARSGAEAVAQGIMENPAIAEAIKNQKSEPVQMGSGSFTVEVVESDEGFLLISTGMAKNQLSTVQLALIRSAAEARLNLGYTVLIGKEGDADDPAIVYFGTLHVTSGSIATNSTAPGSIRFNGAMEVSEGQIVQLTEKIRNPLPAFPSPPVFENEGTYNASVDGAEIASDGHYSKLIIPENNTLTINLAEKTRIISIDRFELNGKLELRNPGKNGRLILYVNEFVKATGSLNVTGEGSHRSDALTVYYKGKKDEIFGNSQLKIRGDVVVQNPAVNIVGNDNFSGGLYLVGEQSVHIAGGSNSNNLLIYAPLGTIRPVGAYTMRKGAIVAARLISPEPPGATVVATFDETLLSREFPSGFFKSGSSSVPGSDFVFERGLWSSGK